MFQSSEECVAFPSHPSFGKIFGFDQSSGQPILPYPSMATPNDIVEIVKSYIGDSLIHNKEDLALLTARQVDDPNQVVQITTNCGMFMLGVWWLAGVQHELLKRPYKTGMAIAWVRQIAIDLKALRTYPKDGPPVLGASMHYYTPGSNNNHVEFLLETPNDKHVALHGGGGRDKNAIATGTGDITWSYQTTRKLMEWVDPEALLVGSPEFHWNPTAPSHD
jgi:hypothetical protein